MTYCKHQPETCQLPHISSGARRPCRTASLHCTDTRQIFRHITSNTPEAPRSTPVHGPYQAIELTVGLGDLQCLPGLLQRPSGDLPSHQTRAQEIAKKPRQLSRRLRKGGPATGGITMMRSTPAAHARASTAGMSAAWH